MCRNYLWVCSRIFFKRKFKSLWLLKKDILYWLYVTWFPLPDDVRVEKEAKWICRAHPRLKQVSCWHSERWRRGGRALLQIKGSLCPAVPRVTTPLGTLRQHGMCVSSGWSLACMVLPNILFFKYHIVAIACPHAPCHSNKRKLPQFKATVIKTI